MATATQTVEIEWRAKLDKFERDIAKLGELPEKQAKSAMAALDKQMKVEEKAHQSRLRQAKEEERARIAAARAAAKAEEEAARAAAKAEAEAARIAAEAAKEPKKRWDDIRKVMAGAGGQFGEMASRVNDLGEGLGGVAGRAGLAVAAVAGIAFAFQRAARAAWELLDSADDMLERLEEIGGTRPIPPETLAAIEEWNKASLAAEASATRLKVIFAGELAPAMTDFASALTGAADVVSDITEKIDRVYGALGATKQAIRDVRDGWLEHLGPLADNAQRLNAAGDALWDWITAGGFAAEIFTRLRDRGEELGETLGNLNPDNENMVLLPTVEADALDDVDNFVAALDDAATASGRVADAQRDMADAARERAQLERQMRGEREAAAAGLQAIIAQTMADDMTAAEQAEERHRQRMAQIAEFARATSDTGAVIDARAASEAQLQQELTEIVAREAAAREAIRLQEASAAEAAQRQILETGAAAFGELSRAAMDYAHAFAGSREDMTEAEKRAALTAYEISRGTALAQIAIQGYLAAARAMAELGPIAGPIAAIGIGATIAGQAAAIGSQSPPEFPTGGIVRPSPDHQLIAAQPGEGIVSRRGMEALGERGLHQLNRGESASQSIEVVMQYRHRIFDRFVRDNLQRPGPLASAISSGSRVGHYTR